MKKLPFVILALLLCIGCASEGEKRFRKLDVQEFDSCKSKTGLIKVGESVRLKEISKEKVKVHKVYVQTGEEEPKFILKDGRIFLCKNVSVIEIPMTNLFKYF